MVGGMGLLVPDCVGGSGRELDFAGVAGDEAAGRVCFG